MNFRDILVFLYIAENTKSKNIFSTAEIAEVVGSSQQTISRKLRELEKFGLIARRPTVKGTEILLTPEGKSFLKKIYASSKAALFSSEWPTITGFVCTGLGEGSYYVSLPQYYEQFKSKLGFQPFRGTLNLKTKRPVDKIVDNKIPIVIDGFVTKKRSFGKIFCYPILIEDKIRGALIFPERSNQLKDVIEIIAPVNLRKEFGLRDGSKISLKVI
ncbi:MAG: CTP-dependent riboflavin kinase [Candidatus Diapherotrites archaeon]|nr:CTP-dependent riboflavin kinase [Candidatus Diapherotrites archaeon]